MYPFGNAPVAELLFSATRRCSECSRHSARQRTATSRRSTRMSPPHGPVHGDARDADRDPATTAVTVVMAIVAPIATTIATAIVIASARPSPQISRLRRSSRARREPCLARQACGAERQACVIARPIMPALLRPHSVFVYSERITPGASHARQQNWHELNYRQFGGWTTGE